MGKHENELNEILKLSKSLYSRSLQKKDNEFEKRIEPFITSSGGKFFLIKLMDTAFRATNLKRITDFVYNLFQVETNYKDVFSTWEKSLISGFLSFGYKLPSISVPLMLSQVRSVSKNLLFYVGSNDFKTHTEQRKDEGVELNINLIGEALLGEEEAKARIENYIELLNQDEINYISIKISTIYSQIKPLAFNQTVDILTDKLTVLYKEVLAVENKTGVQKFINLDMEEYRDMDITVAVFLKTLSKPEFKGLRAGIVLQAYLPDSYNYLQKLISWSNSRVSEGGAPIKVRVVKGANLEMEKVESELEHWPLVTYENKLLVDANYKKMLLEFFKNNNLKAVHLGVASHNIFDLSFAIYHSRLSNYANNVEIEMLEGMANGLVNVLLKDQVKILLYTPIVYRQHFTNAIAYLVRRLDEGTMKGNFLRESIGLEVDSAKWEELEQSFIRSFELIEKVSNKPNRIQNKFIDTYQIQKSGFKNSINTDWILRENQKWAEKIKSDWMLNPPISKIEVEYENKPSLERDLIEQVNWQGEIPWKYELATQEDYDLFISQSKNSEWLSKSHRQRIDIIRACALELEKRRSDLIGVAVLELGKTISEVDVEVSEAVDFANFYAHSMEELLTTKDAKFQGKGVNLILSPWNFPVAIPCGGVIASLVSGNTAILKPSKNAAASSRLVCEALWRAGVPKSALGFLPVEEVVLDKYLIKNCPFGSVILTGGTETAEMLLNRNPYLPLYAETGGKNATIVTALSDREQAIKNVVQSAFGNTGQKCSATSLLVLEEEVFNDKNFKTLLKDAVESKKVGCPWDFDTEVGPLSVLKSQKLLHAIDSVGEWLVKPEMSGEFNITPGVLWGVNQDHFTFNNELFAPILSVVKANDLTHAIEIANKVPFGLTSGIESLVKQEIDLWKNEIEAGNLYINRSTTGAIVQRQPFGGIKKSSYGYGMKAGGYNYLVDFMQIKESVGLVYRELQVELINLSETKFFSDLQLMKLAQAYHDYNHWYEVLFSKEIDYSKVLGQHNISRYIKPTKINLCVDNSTEIEDIALVYLAQKVLQVPFLVQYVGDLKYSKLFSELNVESVQLTSWSELVENLNHKEAYRVLIEDQSFSQDLKKFHEQAIHPFGNKPMYSGRIELLNYLTEQSISHTYHRYGNLMGEDVK